MMDDQVDDGKVRTDERVVNWRPLPVKRRQSERERERGRAEAVTERQGRVGRERQLRVRERPTS